MLCLACTWQHESVVIIAIILKMCRPHASHSRSSPRAHPLRVRHLADDTLSNDEASVQSGVGGGGDTDVGAMHLDSNSGYVCTLDFPNLTRYQIRDACGLKPVLQHGE